MISGDYARMMARYNAWQNDGILRAASSLGDAARRKDRGAFFGSVHRTLSHLLWGDLVWMCRFAGGDAPAAGLSESADWIDDWEELHAARKNADARILDWAAGLSDGDLSGDLEWHSGVLGRKVVRPKALCVMHFFNHQTHHRGQVHTMLTAAGARTKVTDLFAMPADA